MKSSSNNRDITSSALSANLGREDRSHLSSFSLHNRGRLFRQTIAFVEMSDSDQHHFRKFLAGQSAHAQVFIFLDCLERGDKSR
jgi:hypothetical protein